MYFFFIFFCFIFFKIFNYLYNFNKIYGILDICVSSYNTKEDECSEGNYKYTCNDASTSCTSERIYMCKPESILPSDRASCLGYYLSSKNSLLKCDGIDCPIQYLTGFFFNSHGNRLYPYIKCYVNAKKQYICSDISSLSSTCSDAGKLIESGNDVKLCLDSISNNAIDIFKNNLSGFYVLPASIFNTTTNSNENYIIKRGDIEVLPDISTNNSNKYYLYNNLILYCNHSSLCTYISNEGFYLVTIGNTENQLVRCLSNKCSVVETTSFGSNNHYFIDAIDFPNKFKKIINCTSMKCISMDISSKLNATSNNLYYIDSSESITKSIISCNAKNGCKIIEGSKVDGQAYIDASSESNVIICSTITNSFCHSIQGKDLIGKADSYINAENLSQIINCQGPKCLLINSDAKAGHSEYYPVFFDGIDKLYVCAYDSDDKYVICKKITTADKKFNVFLNPLYGKPNGDTTHQLIRCDNSGNCKPEVVSIYTSEKVFFPNSDTTDNTDSLKYNLIECSKNELTVTCSVISGNVNQVYMNENFVSYINTKQIIQCYEQIGCIEKQTNSSNTKPVYYINAGNAHSIDKLKDIIIKCTDNTSACSVIDANNADVYINGVNNAELIHCYLVSGCISISSRATDNINEVYLNSNDLITPGQEALINDLIKCKMIEGIVTCATASGSVNDVYLNANNSTEIIYCISNGCITKASTAKIDHPEYYINSDDKPLSANLIKCKNIGQEVICEIITGKHNDVYINSNFENDSTKKPLIICTNENGCTTNATEFRKDMQPTYYVNSGSVMSNKLNDTLIKCINNDLDVVICAIERAEVNNVYINYNENNNIYPLIKCNRNGCNPSSSAATKDDNEYYINSGDTSKKIIDYDIIECSYIQEEVICKELDDINIGVYLNSNYNEPEDNNQLIQCSSNNGCQTIKVDTSNIGEYYVNAGSKGLTDGIIFCFNKNCEKQTPNENSYYVGINKYYDENNEKNGLIECGNSEFMIFSLNQDINIKKCTFKSAFSSIGYYLNAGYNKADYQVILCDVTKGCQYQKVDLGYYLNAGDVNNPIIKCENEGTECVTEEFKNCPEAKNVKPGDYCSENDHLKFYPTNNSTGVVGDIFEDFYIFATIPANKFPGIKSTISTLFKISRFSINQLSPSGIVIIDKYGKLIENLNDGQRDVFIYECNTSTKSCKEKLKCTSNTYAYDAESQRVLFCNNGIYRSSEFIGYVVDSSRTVNYKHPYLIKCEKGGKCINIKPEGTSYFINSGNDANANKLIHCSNGHCVTKTAEIGNFVGQEGDGIIKCTSLNYCIFRKVKAYVKFANSGSDKTIYGIISCTLSKGCIATKANIGYYLTYINTLLIECTSSSSCTEIKPTINYYNYADSTEIDPSIIKCIQDRQDITCSLEQTNRGYYITSFPKILIHCRIGKKCKYVNSENGIYRESLKKLTYDLRHNEENEIGLINNEIDETNEAKNNKNENIELINKSNIENIEIKSRKIDDDAYGIIKCVKGKCISLSYEEIIRIPICEFNHNKCFISSNYAKNKYATISVSPGEICTSEDRSILYFAIDVIGIASNTSQRYKGITNCLEINDSYSDKFFTIGSNIYRLSEDCVIQFYDPGYYFINTKTNIIVTSNDIDDYNNENVILYRCDGSKCDIVDKPNSPVYYTDVNKRIFLYNINSNNYSFAYEKDIMCIFKNNQCTPNRDLKEKEFCITYKGELILAKTGIKNRETGECYRAPSIISEIYGYNKYLYSMNIYSAEMVTQTGYYIVNISTNTTVNINNNKFKNNQYVIYGCQQLSCKIYEPDESIYYYDAKAKNILRYKNGIWNIPTISGYAYISIDPSNSYIYHFTKTENEIKINDRASYGYYYTIDGKMYNCNQEENGGCIPIDDTDYYFTNAGEIYYCIYDSQEKEPIECTKQNCVINQYYYIDGNYYHCESNSILVRVRSRSCSFNKKVIVNFPVSLTTEYPNSVKQAIENIKKIIILNLSLHIVIKNTLNQFLVYLPIVLTKQRKLNLTLI